MNKKQNPPNHIVYTNAKYIYIYIHNISYINIHIFSTLYSRYTYLGKVYIEWHTVVKRDTRIIFAVQAVASVM